MCFLVPKKFCVVFHLSSIHTVCPFILNAALMLVWQRISSKRSELHENTLAEAFHISYNLFSLKDFIVWHSYFLILNTLIVWNNIQAVTLKYRTQSLRQTPEIFCGWNITVRTRPDLVFNNFWKRRQDLLL